MRSAESLEIDGVKFTVQQLGGKAAGRLFVRINSYLIPAIGQTSEALGKLNFANGLNSDVDMSAVGKALSGAATTLFEKLTEDEYEALLGQLLETARYTSGGKDLPLWPNFDDVMAGKVLTQLKLLRFALEVNFRDFAGALAGLGGIAAGAVSKLSTTSKPTGPAGD